MSARLFLLLYLLRDTLHRWCKRISSPLSRLLVVLSLSFCGLVFLSNYALSIRMLEDKITRSGADLLIAGEFLSGEKARVGHGRPLLSAVPGECELFIFHDLFLSGKVGSVSYSVVEYPPEMVRRLPDCGNAVFVLPDEAAGGTTPADIDIEGFRIRGITLAEKHAGFLRKLYTGGAIFIPQGSFSLNALAYGMLRKYVLRFCRLDVELVTRWEQMLTLLSRLDERNLSVVSSRQMLQELEQLRQLQYYFRLGIVLGCSFVIGLLLTSISSMEFRQNEYVYALMGSFGISRLTLFFTFVAENTLLVFGGFGVSLLALSHMGPWLVEKLYHLEGYVFSMRILEDDVRIFLTAFMLCIPVSCLPIMAAIFRPIGKILK